MRAVLCVVAVLSLVLAGCIAGNDEGPSTDTGVDGRLLATFPNPQPDVVTKLEPLSQLMHNDSAYPTGSGNWVQGDYVYGSALNEGFFIADVSDPADPVLVFQSPQGEGVETPFARKAEVVTHPDGRLTLVLATQSNGMHLWDVTDPANAKFAAIVHGEDLDPEDATIPTHNIAVVPGTEYVFNNPSRGTGSTNHLVDVSDPENPVVVGNFGAFGCHGTTWRGTFGDADFRAYCAAIDRTEIWDMSGLDAAAPDLGIKLLGVVETAAGNSPIAGNPLFGRPALPVESPVPVPIPRGPIRTLHHLAMANADGTILIVGDEHNGGGSPGACFFNDGTRSTPFGALWFYDISNEMAPELLSWISPPLVEPRVPTPPQPDPDNPLNYPNTLTNALYSGVPNCTAHFGTLVPGEEKLVMAWYTAGVLLVDFTDPAAPVILDQYQPEGVNVWNARVHNGYVFTGDIGRGLDIVKLA